MYIKTLFCFMWKRVEICVLCGTLHPRSYFYTFYETGCKVSFDIKRISAERSKVTKPKSLLSLGPVKSSTFFLERTGSIKHTDMRTRCICIHTHTHTRQVTAIFFNSSFSAQACRAKCLQKKQHK